MQTITYFNIGTSLLCIVSAVFNIARARKSLKDMEACDLFLSQSTQAIMELKAELPPEYHGLVAEKFSKIVACSNLFIQRLEK